MQTHIAIVTQGNSDGAILQQKGKLSAWFVKKEFKLTSGIYVMLWHSNNNDYIGWMMII